MGKYTVYFKCTKCGADLHLDIRSATILEDGSNDNGIGYMVYWSQCRVCRAELHVSVTDSFEEHGLEDKYGNLVSNTIPQYIEVDYIEDDEEYEDEEEPDDPLYHLKFSDAGSYTQPWLVDKPPLDE